MYPEEIPCFICDKETELYAYLEIKTGSFIRGSRKTKTIYESHEVALCKKCINKMRKHLKEGIATPEGIFTWIIDR